MSAIILIALISVSRLYLGVHLPIDIVVGVLLGALVVLLLPALDRLQLDAPVAVQVTLSVGIPLALHLFAPTPDSAMLLGGLTGFLLAPPLFEYRLPRSPA